MPEAASRASAAPARTALLVVGSADEPLLCPFFGKCDGILLVNGSHGSQQYYRRDPNDTMPLPDMLLRLKPARLICGFVDAVAKQRLLAAGIDVRLGSCSCPIAELVAGFHNLPRA